MDDSNLLDFIPVPLRARRDGWTVARPRLFIEALAQGLRPGTAARRLGLSRQTAYALRRRPGAEGFAAAWEAAVEMARRRRIASRPASLYERAVEGCSIRSAIAAASSPSNAASTIARLSACSARPTGSSEFDEIGRGIIFPLGG